MEYLLDYKNKWGNYQRFTDENGEQEYPTNTCYDHMTPEDTLKRNAEYWRNLSDEELNKLGFSRATPEQLKSIK